MNKQKWLAVFIVLFCCVISVGFIADPITDQMIYDAQKDWGDAIVKIGKAYSAKEDYKQIARSEVKRLYAYDFGTVLFKPTKASAVPFRPTLDAAVSYFVGGKIPEDHGFAIKPWSKVRFADVNNTIGRSCAVSMGHYYFTDAKTGKETKVEFTFGYTFDKEGKLRINVHHSSFPYQPEK